MSEGRLFVKEDIVKIVSHTVINILWL